MSKKRDRFGGRKSRDAAPWEVDLAELRKGGHGPINRKGRKGPRHGPFKSDVPRGGGR